MSYTPPTSPLNSSWVGAPTYRGPARAILGTWVTPTQWIYQPASAEGGVGAPTVIGQQLVSGATAGEQTQWGTTYALTKVLFYRPPQHNIEASWVGRPAYIRTIGASLSVTWDQQRAYVTPPGFLSEAMGEPVITQQQFVRPAGFSQLVFGDTYAIFPYQYAPPRWTINASWVGKAACTPAVGVRDGLWTLPSEDKYVPLTGWDSNSFGAATLQSYLTFVAPGGIASLSIGAHQVRNAAAALRPAGVASTLTFGATLVAFGQRKVTPPGFDHSAFGASAVVLKNRRLFPGGFVAGSAGDPTIINRNRYVAAGNIVAPAWGANPTIWLYTRYLLPNGLVATGFSSTNRISHDRQYAQLNAGIPTPGFGTAWISQGTRMVAPAGAFFDAVARPNVGGTRFLSPPGWDSSAFGTRIIPVSQTVAPQGFREVWGATTVKNYLSFVLPPGFETNVQEQYRWGRAQAYNLRQIVLQQYDPNDGLNPPAWSQWTAIENRNKTVATFSTAPPRPGEPLVFNNARVIAPAGMTPPGYPGTMPSGLVAYGVRQLPMDGIEPPPVLRWTAVYNAARVIAPVGEDAKAFGLAATENTRRYYQRIGDIDSVVYGVPFIDFAIRTLALEPRYAIQPPDVPLPEVKLYTRYVDPKGDDMARVGLVALSIHFNIVAPKWAHRDIFGEPRVLNVTPEMRGYGWNAEEFGDAFVRLQFRPVAPDGNSMQLFGQAKIADRKQSIAVPGNNFMRIGDKLVVTRTGAPPYSPQWIIQDGEPVDSLSAFGKPGLNQYVLYPFGIDALKVGDATVRSNGIMVDAGIKVDGYGVPTVGLKRRVLTVQEWPGAEVFEPSPARITPHTIWAVVEAPAQAIRNHGATNLHYVGQTVEYGPGARFGRHSVRTYRGVLAPFSLGNTAQLGTASVQLHRRYLEPAGMQAYRMGWVIVGDGTQFVKQFGGADMQVFGQTAVARGPYLGPQTVKPAGLAPPDFGVTWISLLHRSFPLIGFNALRMGSSRGEPPYQWQSLHVGPLMSTIPSGFNAQRFGSAWISLRIRGLEPQGFDGMLLEYDPEHFADRMRVRNAYLPPGPAPRMLALVGVDLAAVGVPNAKPAVHFIRPDGNADQYRKGAF
ncbi:hypothetical protein [Variovorax paradoxus]|uniref:hypothetical protein n=1 Tax=Variovorax paradoxus TaxID=34073 RepID=UPI003D656C35